MIPVTYNKFFIKLATRQPTNQLVWESLSTIFTFIFSDKATSQSLIWMLSVSLCCDRYVEANYVGNSLGHVHA